MKDTPKHVATGETNERPTVYDFLKLKGEFAYPTEDSIVYSSIIAKMNLADLQTHAMSKGIKPSTDRRRLELALINQFKTVVAKRKIAQKSKKFTPEELKQAEEQRQKSIENNRFLNVIV